MTSLPAALAVNTRATQMNMRILFTSLVRLEIMNNDSFLHITRNGLMYTFQNLDEVWYLDAIGPFSMDMKITDDGLIHLLDTYAQQAQKEAQQ